MRRFVAASMLGCVVMLGVVFGQASRSTAVTKETDIRGCVDRSERKYILTDTKGRSYDLLGPNEGEFFVHVGHEVIATGNLSKNAKDSPEHWTLSNVVTVKHIGDKCNPTSVKRHR